MVLIKVERMPFLMLRDCGTSSGLGHTFSILPLSNAKGTGISSLLIKSLVSAGVAFCSRLISFSFKTSSHLLNT
ncbi:hypothetical protein X975_25391, partial [Stegodyphus mimosarum]